MAQFDLNEIPIRIPAPLRGLVTMRGIDEAPLNSLREAQNVRFDKGVLTKLPGASKFGTALDNPVIGIFEIMFATGTQYIIAITTTSLYRWDYNNDVWIQDSTNLAGEAGRQVSWCMLDDALVFSNFSNIKRWTGPSSLADQISTAPTGITTLRSRFVAAFGGRLLLLHTVEDGTEHPTRLRYSALNDGRDFQSHGAGYYDFDDNSQPGMGMLILSDYIIVYKERTIFYGRQTGNAANPFSFRTLRSGVGPALPFTVSERKDKHWFVGWDGAHEVTPGAVTDISPEIRKTLVDALNDAAFATGWATVLEEFPEAWFLTAENSDDYPQNGWIYNYDFNSWTRFLVPGTIQLTAGGETRKLNTFLAWDDAQGTWDSQTETWGAAALEEGTPVNLLGSFDGQVYELDATQANWDGAAIDAYFTSQLIAVQDGQGAEVVYYVKAIQIWYFQQSASCTLTVSLSLDEGTSWPHSDTVTLAAGDGDLAVATAHFFVQCHAFMVRIRNNVAGETFKIRGFTPIVSPGARPL